MKISIYIPRGIFFGMTIASSIASMSCSPTPDTKRGVSWESVENIDYFYRNFDETAPLRFTEDDIKRAATFKGGLKGRSELARLIGTLSDECEAVDEPSEDKMDLHLLMRAHGSNKEEIIWKSSPFHFYDSKVGRVCLLNPKDREKISALMQRLSVAK